MLTVDQFRSLEEGDEVHDNPFLPRFCDEPLVLHVLSVSGDTVTFAATYFGVTLFEVAGEVVADRIVWRKP